MADLYRRWLRGAGKTGDRLVVECGRLLDPWQVVRAGLVPYWCENATRRSVDEAEWWLAGSEPFSSVDVLPEPPGLRSPALAGLPQWLAVAAFGRRRRALDRTRRPGLPGGLGAHPAGHRGAAGPAVRPAGAAAAAGGRRRAGAARRCGAAQRTAGRLHHGRRAVTRWPPGGTGPPKHPREPGVP